MVEEEKFLDWVDVKLLAVDSGSFNVLVEVVDDAAAGLAVRGSDRWKILVKYAPCMRILTTGWFVDGLMESWLLRSN
jgi:hypothetical protein